MKLCSYKGVLWVVTKVFSYRIHTHTFKRKRLRRTEPLSSKCRVRGEGILKDIAH